MSSEGPGMKPGGIAGPGTTQITAQQFGEGPGNQLSKLDAKQTDITKFLSKPYIMFKLYLLNVYILLLFCIKCAVYLFMS